MLQPEQRTEIPEMTRLIAKTAFPNGSVFMALRDGMGPIFEDERSAHLYLGTDESYRTDNSLHVRRASGNGGTDCGREGKYPLVGLCSAGGGLRCSV